jgi:hypothetical protein
MRVERPVRKTSATMLSPCSGQFEPTGHRRSSPKVAAMVAVASAS